MNKQKKTLADTDTEDQSGGCPWVVGDRKDRRRKLKGTYFQLQNK